MSAAPRSSPFFSRRTAVFVVVGAGLLTCGWSFRDSRERERDRAQAEFVRRTTVRHTLTREVLGRYEDALYGLTALFMLDGDVTRLEFQRAVERVEARNPGAQAYEWVPYVPGPNRADAETLLQRAFPRRNVTFTELDSSGQLVRAADRPFHYPISFIEPLRDNEAALGMDLAAGAIREVLATARRTGRIALTHQVRLVQEKADQFGLVMVSPVFRMPRVSQPADTETFLGFVQAVFRVPDLLERTRTQHPDTILDMLFIDASETDPARRGLYYRPADDSTPRTPLPSEAEFRAGPNNELSIPMGGRDWRVLYRPRPGWIEAQFSPLPWVRSFGVLLVTALVAGLVHTLGRRTELIQDVVAERTAQLEESRRRLDSLMHALPGMAFRGRYDERLTVVFVSEGAQLLTGRPAADFISGAMHFRDLIHPDDIERVRAATRAALDERRDFELEYRIRQPDGTDKWVLARGRGVYDATGRLDVFEGLAIDITAQKLAERERLNLERKLLEGQKLESLGLLAGGIAHDFNNLLSSVLGNASMARLTLPAGSPAEQQLRAVEAAGLRAAELCRQMLAYAGKGRFVVEATDLSTLTEDLLPLLNVSVARQATLDLRLARGLPAVMADATQLRQIVMNLVLNAADAIGENGGEITLTTGRMRADAALLARCVTGAGLPAGDYIFLEVRDTGSGMAPEVLEKIFDPFFTTKFAGRGLGLAAALGIVRSHNGALAVESAPGRGTVFRLLLPPTKSTTAPHRAASSPAAHGSFTGRVLVIEDEEHVRAITVEILRSLGLDPRGAADGAAGIAAFRADPATVSLVVLDLLMPGLNGEQTLALLRGIRPDIPVLLMSGYAEGDIIRRLAGTGPLRFMAKPFTRETLEQNLRELLG